MLATILIYTPIALSALAPLRQDVPGCRLEVLSPRILDERVLAGFDANVQAYVALHGRLVWSMDDTASGSGEDGAFRDALRAAIVAARPLARQGDFFTPHVADVFRARIDRALLFGIAGAAAPLYEPAPGEPAPEVNEPFPAVFGPVEWPAILFALPQLPYELGYALWGRHLVVVDVPANLVVDVLPNALPEGARPGVIYP